MNKVDPIHFFDCLGRSMLTRVSDEQYILDLEKQNKELKDLLRKTAKHLRKELAKSKVDPIINFADHRKPAR